MRRGFFQSTTVRLALALLLAQVAALALGLTVIHRFTAATILADARTAAEVAPLATVTAVDLSGEMLARAARNVARAALINDCQIVYVQSIGGPATVIDRRWPH